MRAGVGMAILVAAIVGHPAAGPAPLAAQEIPRFVPATAPASPTIGGSGPALPGLLKREWVRPIASAALPGTGQLLAGQARGIVYLAFELWVASRAVASGRRGDQQAAHFRELAYDVARRQFAAARVDGPFEYYESMEKFVASGVYDADPGPAFAPESDSTTYNGSVWRLARHTYFVNPDSTPDTRSPPYLQAVAFYQARAVGAQFRWSWSGARLEQDVFRTAIRESDDAYRRRTNYLGALVLNHLASTIDALIGIRTGRRGSLAPQVRFHTDPDLVTLLWTGRF